MQRNLPGVKLRTWMDGWASSISYAIIPTASVYVSAAPTPLGYEFIGLDPETRIPDSAAPLMENLSANFLSSLALCCNLQFRQLLAGPTPRVKWIAPTQSRSLESLGSDVFISCAYLHCGPCYTVLLGIHNNRQASHVPWRFLCEARTGCVIPLLQPRRVARLAVNHWWVCVACSWAAQLCD